MREGMTFLTEDYRDLMDPRRQEFSRCDDEGQDLEGWVERQDIDQSYFSYCY